MPETIDTLVVGGGLAGIAAALELRRAGEKVLLVEKSAQLGGKAGSVMTSAGEFPTGPTSFNGRQPAFWKLIELLGLEDEVVQLHPRSSERFIVRDGRLRALRPSPLSVLTTGALSLGEKLSCARELFTPGRAPDVDESLEALLVRRFGRSAVDHFFAAVFTGIFAGDLSRLSARTCMPMLVAAEREQGSVIRGALRSMKTQTPGTRAGLYTFKRGFGVIGERAAAVLPCRVGVEVESLALAPAGVAAMIGGQVVRARRLVMATEADVASQLLPDVRELHAFDYAPITLVQWAESTPGDSKVPHGFGWLAAPIEKRFALGTLFVGDLRGESPRRFSTFIGGALQPERAALPREELIAGVAEDLRGLTGGSLGEVVNVIRWRNAVFQPAVGHADQVAALRAATSHLPVAFVGSYLGGAAMKDALASGFAVQESRGAVAAREAA
ncbi:MAG: protoporphyrinogen oxidase [Archangium sp.]